VSVIPLWPCPLCKHVMKNVVVGPVGSPAVIKEIRCEKCGKVSPADPHGEARQPDPGDRTPSR